MTNDYWQECPWSPGLYQHGPYLFRLSPDLGDNEYGPKANIWAVTGDGEIALEPIAWAACQESAAMAISQYLQLDELSRECDQADEARKLNEEFEETMRGMREDW